VEVRLDRGRATLTIVVSRMIISCPRQTTKSAIHLRRSNLALWSCGSFHTVIITISRIILD